MFLRRITVSIRSITSTASPRIASRRFTSPGTRNTASTFWTRTTTRSSIPSGNFTSAPFSAPVIPQRSSNGTTAFPPSRKFTTKPSKPVNSCAPPSWRKPYEIDAAPAHHGTRRDATAHFFRTHAAPRSGRRPDEALCFALHQAERPAHFFRASRNLQSPILVSRALRARRGFPWLARRSRGAPVRRHGQGVSHRQPVAFVHASQSWLAHGIVAAEKSQVGRPESSACAGYRAARVGGHRSLRRKGRSGVAPGRSFECGWREAEADAAAVCEDAEFSLPRR